MDYPQTKDHWELMKSVRSKYNQANIIVSDRKTIHKHRVENKKTNPFLDAFPKNGTWISGLYTYNTKGSQHSGFSQGQK